MGTLEILNDDVLYVILTFVDKNEIVFLKETCKLFYDALRHFKTRFPRISYIFSEVKFLEWAIEHDYKIDKKSMFKKAIRYGKYPDILLQYLQDEIDHNPKYLKPSLYTLAIEMNQVNTIKWLIKNRCLYSSYIFDAFSESKTTKWVFENFVWNENQMRNVIQNNNLEELKWVLSSLPFLSDFVCNIAAECNVNRILKWAVHNKFVYDEETISNCALNGNLKMIKFLHKNKCDSNQWVIANACSRGHLNVVKWCIKNNYEVSEYAFSEAESNGHLHVLNYLKLNIQ